MDISTRPFLIAAALTALCSGSAHAQVTSLTTGVAFTCGHSAFWNGAQCWGRNADGRLGIGDTDNRGDQANEMGVELPFPEWGTVVYPSAIFAGGVHACALLDSGELKCWGGNSHGQLGLGDTQARGDGSNEMGDQLQAVALGSSVQASSVALGRTATCALITDGRVKCWGDNTYGQLGLGDTTKRGDGPNEMGDNLPFVSLTTEQGRTVVELVGGFGHFCARFDNGKVKCWGENNLGQLGLGNTNRRGDGPSEMGNNLPYVNLGSNRTAQWITASYNHTCALLDNNTIKCWGSNTHGQLGLGNTAARGDGANEMGNSLPAVSLGTGLVPASVHAGYLHTCVVLTDGRIKCWGGNSAGQLGLGNTTARGDGAGEMGNSLPFVDVGTGLTVFQVVASDAHTCALLDDLSVKCWGENSQGQLGHGNTLKRGDGAGEMGNALPFTNLSEL